jgi:hypothetical protein
MEVIEGNSYNSYKQIDELFVSTISTIAFHKTYLIYGNSYIINIIGSGAFIHIIDVQKDQNVRILMFICV